MKMPQKVEEEPKPDTISIQPSNKAASNLNENMIQLLMKPLIKDLLTIGSNVVATLAILKCYSTTSLNLSYPNIYTRTPHVSLKACLKSSLGLFRDRASKKYNDKTEQKHKANRLPTSTDEKKASYSLKNEEA